jgi:micrococcal nuclease
MLRVKALQPLFIPLKRMRFVWILLLLMACNTRDSRDGRGTVVKIADGDTFTMLTSGNQQVKVRLYGIDCPERAQDFGTVARRKLSELIFGQMVRTEKKDVDRYGRTIAIVYNSKGINVNEELLREGLAWHYKEYDQNTAWDALMLEAKRKKQGLWAHPNPTPPWQWRKKKRQPAREAFVDMGF